MAATSVTGVSGSGSAQGHGTGNKGSEHMSLAVHRLIGPRVVACGCVDLDGETGFGTVYYPELAGDADLYCPFLSTGSGTHAYWGNFTETSFDVTGATGDTVCWEIVKKGLWGSLNNNGPKDDLADT